MAKYIYKAVNASGKVVEGQVDAANEADLELRMSNMSLDLIRYKTEAKPILKLKGSKIDRKEIITFTFHLEKLLGAGVPIIDGLHDLRDSTSHGAFKDIVSEMIESIGSGKTFSESLAKHKNIFSKVYVSMVEVGERSGRLVEVLADLHEMLKWQDELTSKAKKIAIYPAFVLTVVLVVTGFLMVYLVPQLIPFIKLAGGELPWHTQRLIDVSGFIQSNWYWALAIFLLGPLFISSLIKHNSYIRYKFDDLKLKFWLLGPISYKIKMARFCNSFALMYISGITVLDAIHMSKNLMNNVVLEEALNRVHTQISEGEAISSSFANVGLFSSLIVRMMKVGESTGAMEDALMNISYFYNREVNDAIESIQPAIMPVITIFLGLIVGWVILSVMNPIYDAVITISAF